MTKQRTNVSIDGAVLEVAREHDLNVSAVCEAALREAGRQAQAAAWKKRNAHVLEQRLRHLEEHGTKLADIAAFQLPPELK